MSDFQSSYKVLLFDKILIYSKIINYSSHLKRKSTFFAYHYCDIDIEMRFSTFGAILEKNLFVFCLHFSPLISHETASTSSLHLKSIAQVSFF